MKKESLPLCWRCSFGIIRTIAWSLSLFFSKSKRFDNRYGLKERCAAQPTSDKAARTLYIHAASLGEWRGAVRFLVSMKNYGLWNLFAFSRALLSSQTITAHRALLETTVEQLPSELLCTPLLYPLDSPTRLERMWRENGVRIAIIYESDLWPGLVESSIRSRVPLCWLSARLTPQAARRWRYAKKLFCWMVEHCTVITAATEKDAERIAELSGYSPEVTGDFKLYHSAEFSKERGKKRETRPIRFAALSLHLKELSTLLTLLQKPNAPDRWVLQPRHLEEAEKMEKLCRSSGWRVTFWPQHPKEGEVAIVKSVGETSSVASNTATALIGGSLSCRIGVHNPLEAVESGATILTGPFWYLREEEFEVLDRFQLRQQISHEMEVWPECGEAEVESIESALALLFEQAQCVSQRTFEILSQLSETVKGEETR